MDGRRRHRVKYVEQGDKRGRLVRGNLEVTSASDIKTGAAGIAKLGDSGEHDMLEVPHVSEVVPPVVRTGKGRVGAGEWTS